MALFAGLVVTAAAWLQLRRAEQVRLADLERGQVTFVTEQVERRMRSMQLMLRGGAGYLGRGRLPSRDEWRAYVEGLNLPDSFPGIQGMGFAEWIPRAATESHIQRVRREGFPDYQIHPGGPLAPDPEGSSSIVYLEPMNVRNQRAFGKDMLREAVRREAMLRARDLGHPILSGKVVLYQEGEAAVQAGTLLYAPVYRQGWPLSTVAERRKALRGWVYHAFRMGDLLEANLAREIKLADIELYDGLKADAEHLLFDSDPSGVAAAGGGEAIKSLEVADRTWTVHLQPNPSFHASVGMNQHLGLLASGLALSLLVFVLLNVVLQAERRARWLASQRGEELLATESKFRTLFEKAPMGMAIVDSTTGRFLSVNPRLGDILGRAPEELLASDYKVNTHPEDLETSLAAVQRLASGVTDEIQKVKRYVHGDGHLVWGRLTMTRLPGEPGSPPRHLSMVEDITEEHAIGEALRLSEQRFKGMFELSPDPITLSRVSDGTLVMANPAWCELTGLSPEEVLGQSPADLGAWPQPEARADLLREIHRTGGVTARAAVLRHKDGTVRQVLITAQVMRLGDEDMILVMGKDVSDHHRVVAALKNSEARYRGIFDLSPDSIALTRLSDGALLEVNPAWCESTGISREEALGLSTGEINRPGGGSGLWVVAEERAAFLADLRAHGQVTQREVSLWNQEGWDRKTLITAKVVLFEGEEVAISIAKDVTDHLRAVAALKDSEARFRSLFEKNLAVQLISDPSDGRIVSANPAALAFYGWAQDAFLGMRLQDFQTDPARNSSMPVHQGTFKHRLASGELREVEVLSSPIVWGGQSLLFSIVHDVTEAMEVRESLNRMYARYQGLFDLSPDGVSVTRLRDGVLIEVNAAWEALFGYSHDEAIGRSTADLDIYVNPEDRRSMVEELKEKGSIASHTVRLRRKDGTTLVAQLNGRVMNLGDEPCLVVVLRDETSRIAMQQSLQESEARFRTVAEQSPVALFIHRKGRFVYLNPAALALLHARQPDDLVGQPVLDRIHPDHLDAVRQRMRIEIEEGVVAPPLEERFFTLDGQVMDAEVQARPILYEGQPATLVFAQDIGDRKRALEALQQREIDLAQAQEIARFGSWRVLHTADGEQWSVSDGLRKIYGYPPGKPISTQTGYEVMHPEDRAPTQSAWTASIEGRGPCEWEHRIRVGDQVKWLSVRVQHLFTPEGVLCESSGTVHDITARKAAEASLRTSESRLRVLGDQLVDSFLYQITAGVDGLARFSYLSAGVERLCGIKVEDVMRDASLLMGQVDPLMLPTYFEAEAACARELKPFAMDLRQRRADGAWRWFRVRSTPRIQSDGTLVWEGISTDITDQKASQARLEESENRFRGVVENAGDAIYLNDEEGHIFFCNQTACAHTGYTMEEMLTLRIQDLDSEYQEERNARSRMSLVPGRQVSIQARHRRKDGTTFPVEVRISLLREAEPRRILAVVRDLSQREQMEESLHRARKAESLVLMAGGIAHDFNNLFQGILGYLEIAGVKARGDVSLSGTLNKAVLTLQKAIELSWKMLDFSGRGFLKPARLELETWLPTYVATLQGSMPPTIQVDLSCDPVPVIQGDPSKLEQVVKVIVDNACEAVGAEGGRIRLRLHTDFGEDRYWPGSPGIWPLGRPDGSATVCLEVSDDGPGVPPETLNLICDPFYTSKELGRGLGLAAMVGVLRAHRAGLHILNGESGGLVVRIHFQPNGV